MQNNVLIQTDKLVAYYLAFQKVILLFSLIFAAYGVRAQAYASLKKPVSAKFQKVTALVFFKDLNRQTGYKFYYSNATGDVELQNLNYDEVPLGRVLGDLSQRGFAFELNNRTLAVNYRKPSAPASPQQQNGHIKGKIIDEKGETLPGANIKLSGSGKTVRSSVDGTYEISADQGTYTVEVSYISYQTKRISDVVVKSGQVSKLDVVLKAASNALREVVVRSTYRQESIAALYTQQKNAASVTDGISAEQIARTPDNNVGAVLKRVSGITTLDNKYVVVRGLTERYNQAMIDGVTVPSTDMNRRNFSFDIFPTELVASVVVNKTATPDVSSEFVGGQVTINTLSIPQNNFISFSAGSGGNTQTTGKNFITPGGRPNSDYFGFDDGRRSKPDNLVSWDLPNGQDDPRIEKTSPAGYKTGYAGAIDQSRRFDNNSFRPYNRTAVPSQNYRFTMGRTFLINEEKGTKTGFVLGLTYRNFQQRNTFETARGYVASVDYFNDSTSLGRGTAYLFNTNWGAVLNWGFQTEKFKLSLKNLYTRTMTEDYYQSLVLDEGEALMAEKNLTDPVFSGLNQHRIEAEHSIGERGIKIAWSASYTRLGQQHKDLRKFTYFPVANALGTFYQQPSVGRVDNMSSTYQDDYRLWSEIRQNDFNWQLGFSVPFSVAEEKSLFKIGYGGWHKQREQGVTMAIIYAKSQNADPVGANDFHDRYEYLMEPDRVGYGTGQAYYYVDRGNGDVSDATSKYHFTYAMLDQQFFKNKLRLVYGLRGENFNLKSMQDAAIRYRKQQEQQFPDLVFNGTAPEETGEKNWYFLPSANVVYKLSSKTNLRAAYGETIIRPDFRETQVFAFPDPLLQGLISGGNIKSTRVKNGDLRIEFYPSAEEVVSLSGFYKYLDKPVELINENPQSIETTLTYKNQHSARNHGMELELRKSLGFINGALSNFVVFGNGSLIYSKVKTLIQVANPDFDPQDPSKAPAKVDVIQTVKRPLMGQSPYIINAGLNYQSDYVGANVVFNRFGYRSYLISTPQLTEFQQGRSVLDLQISGRLLRKRAEIKLNISNLLNTADEYYLNSNSWSNSNSLTEPFTRIKGSDRYEAEDGDVRRYKQRYGRTYNLQLTYNIR